MADFDFDVDAGDQGLIGLGQAVQGFAKGMMDAEDRNYKRMEMEAKFKANEEERNRHAWTQAMEQRRAEREEQKFQADQEKSKRDHERALFKDHMIEKPEGGYSSRPMDQIELDNEKRKFENMMKVAEVRAQADPFGLKSLGAETKKTELESKKREENRKSLSPVQGYQKTDSYVGTPEEEKALRNAKSELDRFNMIIGNLSQRVKSANKRDLANPLSDTAKSIKNDLRDLQLIYKGPAFAQLGVLTGPDLMLLEEIIENPGSVSNLLSGTEGVLGRYQQAAARVNQSFDAKTKTLGLAPASQNPQGLVPAGLVNNPQGLVQPSAGDLEAKKRRLEELRRKAQGG